MLSIPQLFQPVYVKNFAGNYGRINHSMSLNCLLFRDVAAKGYVNFGNIERWL